MVDSLQELFVKTKGKYHLVLECLSIITKFPLKLQIHRDEHKRYLEKEKLLKEDDEKPRFYPHSALIWSCMKKHERWRRQPCVREIKVGIN